MSKDVRTSALIPAFECGQTIARVVQEARRHVPDLLVVDDGSSDDTAARAREAGARVVRRTDNGGKGAAIRDGLRQILEDAAVTHVLFLDGDGQHDGSDIPRLLDAARSGERFVIGSRMEERRRIPAYRFETNRIGAMILERMTGLRIEDGQSGFRLIDAELLRRIRLKSNGYLIENEILLKCAPHLARVATVPVRAIYGGPSHYRPFRDTWMTSWGSVFIKVFET